MNFSVETNEQIYDFSRLYSIPKGLSMMSVPLFGSISLVALIVLLLVVLLLIGVPVGMWIFSNLLQGYNEGRGYASDEE